MVKPNSTLPPVSDKDIERFWSRIKIGNPEDCWPWTRSISNGYGQIKIKNKQTAANRLAYFLSTGKDPGESCVLHNCPNGDNPACCNPAHLWLGTLADNNADKVKKSRQAKGDTHMSRTKPWALARGDKNGSRKHPEKKTQGR